MFNEYLYKGTVLNIKNDAIKIEFDCGFYSFVTQSVNLLDENLTQLRGQNANLPITITEGSQYLFRTYKPYTQILQQGRQPITTDQNFTAQLIKQSPSNPKTYAYKANVISVHDGDTFKAKIDVGFNISIIMDVRMQGINAPELSTGKPGTDAKLWLENKIKGKEIILETFKNKEQFEKYGRYLALAYEPQKFVPNNSVLSLNSDMLTLKLATVMV
jgi:hypothetical protein